MAIPAAAPLPSGPEGLEGMAATFAQMRRLFVSACLLDDAASAASEGFCAGS